MARYTNRFFEKMLDYSFKHNGTITPKMAEEWKKGVLNAQAPLHLTNVGYEGTEELTFYPCNNIFDLVYCLGCTYFTTDTEVFTLAYYIGLKETSGTYELEVHEF